MSTTRRHFMASAALSATGIGLAPPAAAQAPALIRPKRLQPGDTIAFINPSSAIYERAPYEIARDSLQALGFKVKEAPNLRARYGQFAGTDAQRSADVNAMFADPSVQGILALTGGSGGNRILQQLDYGLIRRNPKVVAGFSDITALINAIHVQTGLVTFHAPVGISEWNAFSVEHFRGTLMEAKPMLLANPAETANKDDNIVPKSGRITTIRGGKARGHLVGGNLAVLTSMAGSPYWPRFDGAILFLEEINEYLYRVDRMLSTLKISGALSKLAGVVVGGFTNCTPGDGNYGTLTLDEIFDDYFKPLNVPVYSGALFGHIKRKFTLPVGLNVEMDADAGTVRYLQPAVL